MSRQDKIRIGIQFFVGLLCGIVWLMMMGTMLQLAFESFPSDVTGGSQILGIAIWLILTVFIFYSMVFTSVLALAGTAWILELDLNQFLSAIHMRKAFGLMLSMLLFKRVPD